MDAQHEWTRHLLIYRVRGGLGDYNHFTVTITKWDLLTMGESSAVAHATWRLLLDNEKDKWGYDTGRPSSTARVLRKLCDRHGVDKVKAEFTSKLVFQCLTPKERL